MIVKIDSLKELSKSMPPLVNKVVKSNKDITKINTDKKYL